MDSILTSIKKLLGIAEDYTHFDLEITIHINSGFSILTQLGVGPTAGFSISNKEAGWTDFIPKNPILEMIKTYLYLTVRLIFDPPSSSAAIESTNKLIAELAWRIAVAAENKN